MRHENVGLLVCALKKAGVVQHRDVNSYIHQIVCDDQKMKCMYGDCPECKIKLLPPLEPEMGRKEVTCYQWQTVRKDDGSTVTEKVAMTKDGFDAYAYLEKLLKPRFTTHVYNIHHQYNAIKDLRKNLDDDECLIHIDFSENYTAEYSSAVQSTHFGASRRQISLHTGMVCRTE